MIGQMIAPEPAAALPPSTPAPRATRFEAGLLVLVADHAGRELLSAAVLYRRADAAAVPLVRRRRCLFRCCEDAGAGVVHSLRNVGHHGASFQRVPCLRRHRATVGLSSRTPSNGRSGRRVAATLLLLAFGEPLLWLFGPHHRAALASCSSRRSAWSPARRSALSSACLNMLGHQHVCALAYALALCDECRAVPAAGTPPWRLRRGGCDLACR